MIAWACLKFRTNSIMDDHNIHDLAPPTEQGRVNPPMIGWPP